MASYRNRKVSLADLSVLINSVGQASLDEKELGFVDADRTLQELLRDLSPFVYVDESALESALYYANLLNERAEFLDFRGNTFDELVNRLGRFNRTHNYFET